MPKMRADQPTPDEPGGEDAQGHMPLKRGATEPMLDEPGMEPDEIRRQATEPGPDAPNAEDAEGHAVRIKVRRVAESPDDPGMEPDEAVKVRV